MSSYSCWWRCCDVQGHVQEVQACIRQQKIRRCRHICLEGNFSMFCVHADNKLWSAQMRLRSAAAVQLGGGGHREVRGAG